MKTTTQHIRDRLLFQQRSVSLEELQVTEWSPEFEQLMRNRLIMGALRYGRLGVEGKSQYDRVTRINQCIIEYRHTGNLECLVDISNLALVEFVEGRHPCRHFHSVDDGEHARVV